MVYDSRYKKEMPSIRIRFASLPVSSPKLRYGWAATFVPDPRSKNSPPNTPQDIATRHHDANNKSNNEKFINYNDNDDPQAPRNPVKKIGSGSRSQIDLAYAK